MQKSIFAIGSTEKNLSVILGLLIMLMLGYHLAYLVRYPAVHGDEAWNASASWHWLTTGNNFDFIHAGPLDQFGNEWVRRPFIGQAPWTLVFWALGLGLFQARLVSWFFGAVVLLLTVMVGSKLYNRLTGLLAALLLSLSQPFLLSAHTARQDMMFTALVLLAFWLVLIAFEKEVGWAHLLAGLSIGLAFDVHLNASLFVLPLAALYLAEYRTGILKQRGTWLVAAGGAAGIAYFSVLHLLPGNGTFFTLNRFNFALESDLPPIETLNLHHLLGSLRDEVGIYHFYDNGLAFALVGTGLVYLLARHTHEDRRLLVFVGTALLSFVLFRGRTSDMYAIIIYPFFMMIVAAGFVGLLAVPAQPLGQRAFVLMLLLLFAVSSIRHVARPFSEYKNYDYGGITTQIDAVIPPNARVVGLPTWWLGLADHPYLSSLNLNYYNFFNGTSLQEGMEMMRPDVVIVDPVLRGALEADEFTPVPYWGVPGQEFDQFLKRQASLVATLDTPVHGLIEIYAIHWE